MSSSDVMESTVGDGNDAGTSIDGQAGARAPDWISWRWTVVPAGVAVAAAIAAAVSWWPQRDAATLSASTPLANAQRGGAVTGMPLPSDRHRAAPPLAQLVDKLAVRMREQTPEDAQGWALLGRTYEQLGRHAEAVDAFAQAARRMPSDATLLADYASALSASQDGSWQGEPARLAARAMDLDPAQPKVLVAAGHVAFEQGGYERALDFWQRALPRVADDAELAAAVRADIESAQAKIQPRSR